MRIPVRRSVRERAAIESLDRRVLLAAASVVSAAPSDLHVALQDEEHRELGINLGATPYYATFWPFADALKMESRGWMHSGGYTSVANSGLDAKGNPVAPGTYHAQPFQNSDHPLRAPRGIYVVTWDGDGDVTLGNLGSPGNPSATLIGGSAAEKRRVYRLNYSWPFVQMTNVNAAGDNPVRNVHVWMPDPADAATQSLEPAAGKAAPLWHPEYVAHLREVAANTGYLRFMDMTATNGSPQVNWADRRPADHTFASGKTNYKQLNVPGDPSVTRYGDIGLPWEYAIELCNTLGVGAWISVPHAANDDYVRNLARLFAGVTPDSPGLAEGLKLYVEHSNEIWSNGSGFVQGDWAQQQASALGLSKAQFNAKRAVEVFRLFDAEYSAVGDGSRADDVVRVAAAFSGNTGYTTPYLAAMDTYAHSYADEKVYSADVLAVTTYFGGSSLIKYAFNEANWLGVNLNNPDDATVNQIFDYWANDLTLNASGTGTEGDSGSGGFGTAMRTLAQQYGLDLVSYEGGPSLYTETVTTYVKDGRIVTASTPGASAQYSLSNYVNANFPDDDAIVGNTDRFTKLLMALNRHPRFTEVYNGVLQIAKAQGLRTHAPYSDIGAWGKFGQWGHKEYLGQPAGSATKWEFVKGFADAEALVRDVDDVQGDAPTLPSNRSLGSVFVGDAMTRDLLPTPGNGSGDEIRYEVIAGKLPPGMTLSKIDDNLIRVEGAPTRAGTYRFLVRALDAHNDPAYAVYAITAQPVAGTSTVYPTSSDTFASQGEAGTGLNGSNDYLYAGGVNRTSYAKFAVNSGIVGKIDRIVLRLYVRNFEGSVKPTGGELWLEEAPNVLKDGQTNWNESNLSNTTAPLTSVRIGAKKLLGAEAGGFYEFDVTEYVKRRSAETGGAVSFALRGNVINGRDKYVAVRLASREFAGGEYAPRLILTQSPANAPAPPQVSIQPINPNPRNSTVDTATIVFDKLVTGVDLADFALARDGVKINLSGVTLSTADNITYTLSGLTPLTRTAGLYALTLDRDASGITDADGVALGDGDSETWLAYASVAGRYLFYNNSAYDTVSDDNAIAIDKTALLPEKTATFTNYSSYLAGINGVMIDINGLPVNSLSASDFVFKTGNTNAASTWTTLAKAPAISVRKGAGVNGTDRVTLVWPDNTIIKTWLQVTIKGTAAGLPANDVFYFGNAIGDSGNAYDPATKLTANATVDATDEVLARNNPRTFRNRAPVDFLFDYNRDALVDAADQIIARNHATTFRNDLDIIVTPSLSAS
ncbi:MAG TPA: DNRLRE domain-containing protein [Tepidisphaeraceae bacterium]|jgi:hypothetical protein